MASDNCQALYAGKGDIDWSVTGLAFLFPAIGGLLFGWDIGSTSGRAWQMLFATSYEWVPLNSRDEGSKCVGRRGEQHPPGPSTS